MDAQGTIDHSKVLPVVHLLLEKFSQLVFGELELRKNQVRLRFAGYDEHGRSFKPYAGLIATRRQWSRKPEPTLIFGFENDKFLHLSEETGILEQSGVSYLSYSASEKQIQRAIDAALEQFRPEINDQSAKLNENDLLAWISQFRHRFKTGIRTLRFRYDKLRSTSRNKSRKHYDLLAAMSEDYVFKEKQRFIQELVGFKGTAAAKNYQNLLSGIEECLNKANEEWSRLHVKVQEPFSDKGASIAAFLLQDLITTLDKMYFFAKEMRVR